jgi:single-strand DNA-binding protein
MNNLNSILIEGNVTRDPTRKETPSGTAVCTFSIATNRYYKKGEEFEQETSFFNIEAWGKLADSCTRECLKGRGVRVVGRLKQDRWTEEGKARSAVKVVAEHVEFKPQAKKDSSATDQPDAPHEDTEYDDIPFDADR